MSNSNNYILNKLKISPILITKKLAYNSSYHLLLLQKIRVTYQSGALTEEVEQLLGQKK